MILLCDLNTIIINKMNKALIATVQVSWYVSTVRRKNKCWSFNKWKMKKKSFFFWFCELMCVNELETKKRKEKKKKKKWKKGQDQRWLLYIFHLLVLHTSICVVVVLCYVNFTLTSCGTITVEWEYWANECVYVQKCLYERAEVF